jgi:hypothetical protein
MADIVIGDIFDYFCSILDLSKQAENPTKVQTTSP